MYSFQNATNEMKAWLPNDFLAFQWVESTEAQSNFEEY
jgi:hypothetical protein